MSDPELEAIRQRKLERLLERHRAGSDRSSAPAEPLEVDPSSLDHVLSEHEHVLLDLWAPWCGPCRALAPILESIARQRQGELVVAKLNVDEHPQASDRFAVQGIPTMILFRQGQEVDRIVGALPEPQLDARLSRSMG